MSALSDAILQRLDALELNQLEILTRLDAIEAKQTTRKCFHPPTVEETYSYFTEHGSARMVADDFYDFYSCKGWMVGKTKMVDWQKAASRWIRANAQKQAEEPRRATDQPTGVTLAEQKAQRVIEDYKQAMAGSVSAKEYREMAHLESFFNGA